MCIQFGEKTKVVKLKFNISFTCCTIILLIKNYYLTTPFGIGALSERQYKQGTEI